MKIFLKYSYIYTFCNASSSCFLIFLFSYSLSNAFSSTVLKPHGGQNAMIQVMPQGWGSLALSLENLVL
ncbi:hypothetical protein JOD17_003355 [Geomicrobium sediminis]|uniref:Secreted protein n=1 Tax=Geomicrobium sediminis TaxID=1347788 RepID=A0ABS2PFQ7_9BACL|nr:hypothetical protein [Geomicrobium sediminis]